MDRAGQEFKTAAELAPARSLLRMRYAEFQITRGAPNDARATLKEVTRQAPDYFPAWVLFARLAVVDVRDCFVIERYEPGVAQLKQHRLESSQKKRHFHSGADDYAAIG